VSWFALSLLSVTFLATTELTQQHLLNGKMALSPRVSTVLAFAIQSLMAVPFVLILYPNEIAKLFQEKVAFQILIVAALSYIGNLFYFQSFKVKNISLSAILVSFSVVMSTILGIIFFDESIGWLKFVGIGLVLAAIVGVNYRNIHLRRNHLFALGAGVIFGTCYALDKSIVSDIHPLVYISTMFPLIALFGFLHQPRDFVRAVKDGSSQIYRVVLISAVCNALYNFFTFTAYTQGGEIGRVDAVNNSQIFLIILFEFLILRHQQQLGRKLAMAVLAYTGILILGLA
jgi:drug/metabolite transporter (DMT)-like permease